MNPGNISNSPRFLLYCHNTIGLGHFHRCILIGKDLAEQFSKSAVLVMTGCSTPHLFELPSGVDYVKVPSLKSEASHDQMYTAEKIQLPASNVFRLRSSIFRAMLKELLPNLFLIDHSPRGLGGELDQTIKLSKKLGVRLIVGFRDILGDPLIVKERWARKRIKRILKAYYDGVLVYGSPSWFDFIDNYDLQDLQQKIHYCGFVVNKRFKVKKDKHPKILVTVGSGRDGDKLVAKFLGACKYLETRMDFKAVVTLGSLMPRQIREAFVRRSRKYPNVEIKPFSPEIESEIANSDAVVSMAGYNTISQVLYQRKPMIVFPRTSVDKEQILRANILEKLGLATLLNKSSTSMDLADALEKVLGHHMLVLEHGLSFNGVENVRQICKLMLNREIAAGESG